MIKAIFFDGAGTLFYLPQSVGSHYAAVAREQGAELCPDALDRAFLHAWKRAPIRSAVGRPRDEDDKGWWRELVDLILAEIPELPANFDHIKFFESAYAHFAQPGVWALYPDVLDVLRQLQLRFQLSVISNFDQRLHKILVYLEIAPYFQHVFISSEVGADKPDPEIYRRALKIIEMQPDQVLHVGDDPKRDWEAAAAAGLHVFKLDRARNSLRDLPAVLNAAAPSLRPVPK
jgi:putative hydrolase of the HAD superfamily